MIHRDSDSTNTQGSVATAETQLAAGADTKRPKSLGAAARLLSVDDVAGYLGVSERWVYEQVRTGTLPAMYIARSWRLRQDDVDAFADSFAWRPHRR
jgi:excisionase family DNA binding protein